MAFPDTELDFDVGFAFGANPSADPSTWTFTDVTQPRPGHVRAGVVISRGRASEQAQVEPTSIGLELVNSEDGVAGIYSPRNPVGPHYGQLNGNTPMRVRVNPGTGMTTRGTAFVPSFAPQWDGPDIDEHVPIGADGVLRRLGQGQSPLKSALRRTYLSPTQPVPRAYWPLEDANGATRAASGLPLGSPLTPLSGSAPSFATGISGSDGALDMISSDPVQLAGTVSLPSASGFQVEFTGLGSDLTPPGAHIYLGVRSGEVLVQLTLAEASQDGQPHHRAVQFVQNGADVDIHSYTDGSFVSTTTLTTQTLANKAIINTRTETSGTALIAHITVYDFATMDVPTTRAPAVDGHAGEGAGARFARLCNEENIPFVLGGTDVAAYAMGAQRPAKLLDLLRECEATSAGVIYEHRTGELGLDLLTYRENRPIALALDYAAEHISKPLDHTDDDRYTRNDVTITRAGGSSGHFVQETGPHGIGIPGDPDEPGVGRYDHEATVNLHTDDQPVQLASYEVGKGTVDAPRYPLIIIDFAANPALIPAWLGCDIGSRITIDNLPAHITPDLADLILEGYIEVLDAVEWIVILNCAPYKPYGIFELADTSGDTSEFVGRLVPDSMTLLIARDSDDTAFRVGTAPTFTVAADDYPMDLRIGGEVITATAGTAVAPPTAATGTAAHADNASVVPTLPSHSAGDLLLILAACRNQGVGNPVTPAGWETVFAAGNMRLMGKIATSGAEATPTVNFAGTSAGDTCSAQSYRLTGCQIDLVRSTEVLNGSAQDIAFPSCSASGEEQVLLIAWKQDDWTSVAPPSGFTEIGEPSSTLGNDQGIWWGRQAFGSPATNVDAGTIVVTGGAAAISRSAVVVLRRDVIDLTVTRSVNGVVKSHALGATLEVEDAYVLGL